MQQDEQAIGAQALWFGSNTDRGLASKPVNHGLQKLSDGHGIDGPKDVLGDALGDDSSGGVDESLVNRLAFFSNLGIPNAHLTHHQEELGRRLQASEVPKIALAQIEHLDLSRTTVSVCCLEECVGCVVFFSHESHKEVSLGGEVKVDRTFG
jgi:hypothetical protein